MRLLPLLLGVCCLLSERALAQDEVHLRGGGRVSGDVNSAPAPGGASDSGAPETIAVTSAVGVRIELRREQVVRVLDEPAPKARYQRCLAVARDTVEDQWKLAEWCREQRLGDERIRHLERTLELDADHADARRALGFVWQGGRWTTPAAIRRASGLLPYEGRWVTQQEWELRQGRERREAARIEWGERLRRLRAALAKGDKQASLQELREVRAPEAVPALVELLQREPLRGLQLLYLERLAEIGTPDAVAALVRLSLTTTDVEVLDAVARHLAARRDPALVEFFTRLLASNENGLVNRAGMLLGELGDKSAIAPLIEGLVTRHVVPQGQGKSRDSLTTSFAKPGAVGEPNNYGLGSLSVGDPEATTPQIVWRQNMDVLHALSLLTGQSYGFDQERWRLWHNAQVQAGLAQPATRRSQDFTPPDALIK